MCTKCADFKGMRNVNGVFRQKSPYLFDKSPQMVGPTYRAVVHEELVKFENPDPPACGPVTFCFCLCNTKSLWPLKGVPKDSEKRDTKSREMAILMKKSDKNAFFWFFDHFLGV